jgi:hypothetical protein
VTLAGGLLDTLSITLSSGVSVATLITAVATWRGARSRGPTITIQRDDSHITFNADDIDPDVMQSLLKQLDAEEPPDGKQSARDESPDTPKDV